jgi:hypothetical protein
MITVFFCVDRITRLDIPPQCRIKFWGTSKNINYQLWPSTNIRQGENITHRAVCHISIMLLSSIDTIKEIFNDSSKDLNGP